MSTRESVLDVLDAVIDDAKAMLAEHDEARVRTTLRTNLAESISLTGEENVLVADLLAVAVLRLAGRRP